MRRRERAPEEGAAPLRLRRYRSQEWGHDPQAFWDALEAWRAAGGEEFDLLEPGPDVPFDASRI